jgi:hypothetical protein
MRKTAFIINGVAVALWVVSLFALYRLKPSLIDGLRLLPVLPYATALIALRAGSGRGSGWVALVTNVVFLVLYGMVIAAAAAGEISRPLFVIGYAALYGVAPCGINTAILVQGRFWRSPDKQGRSDGA